MVSSWLCLHRRPVLSSVCDIVPARGCIDLMLSSHQSATVGCFFCQDAAGVRIVSRVVPAVPAFGSRAHRRLAHDRKRLVRDTFEDQQSSWCLRYLSVTSLAQPPGCAPARDCRHPVINVLVETAQRHVHHRRFLSQVVTMALCGIHGLLYSMRGRRPVSSPLTGAGSSPGCVACHGGLL